MSFAREKDNNTMQLPGYTFGEKIGEGGMATVYRGQQLSLARPVAIKVLGRQMREHSQILKAFERESLIIAALNHPNIIHVIDRGVTESGTPYFIMEYVDGIDLAGVLREGELPLERKLELALQICKALSYAHQNGVIHRDIKPANILIDDEFNPRVLDFGIAQFDRAEPDASGRDVMGTLSYLAPELLAGEAATVASDIYSLGLVIFEMLVGHLPEGERRRPSDYGCKISEGLDRAICAATDPNPAARPASVAEISEQILLCLRGAHLSPVQQQRAEGSLDKRVFSLLDVLRDNSFGAVYLFAEKNSARQLVVKKYRLASTGNTTGSIDPVRAGIGYTSAKRLAALFADDGHIHLAKVHGSSKNSRAFIVVMEYLSGGSLQQRLIRPFAAAEFVHIARQICLGLDYAHRNHLVHGNLRASNVMFDGEGRVKLSDFGLPPHYDPDQQRALEPALRQKNWYALPDEPISVGADIYALGVIFYQLLVGELPRFDAGKLQRGRAFKALPELLRELLQSMLQQEPAARPQAVSQVLVQLDRIGGDMDTIAWTPTIQELPKSTPKPVEHEKKKLLLLCLLVLLFMVMLNTGLITLMGSDRLFSLIDNFGG